MSNTNNDNEFRRIRRAALRFLAKNSQFNSTVLPEARVKTTRRGTLVSQVIRSLINDGRIVATKRRVRNPSNRHTVRLYSVR